MCTIIVRHGIDSWCTTLVAANRDEFYDREATSPMVLSDDPRVVGGRDDSKGGTWFGVTDQGVFVGLTNQRNFGWPDGSLKSRGELVLRALETGSQRGIRAFLERTDPRLYNEFNLVFGDGVSLAVAYGRRTEDRVEVQSLDSGVHVLCNDRLGSPEFPKALKARKRVLSIGPEPWDALKSQLTEVLSDETLPDPSEVPPIPDNALFDQELARHLQALCVRTPVYGTVSATLAAVRPGRVEQYHYARTDPASGAFDDYTALAQGGKASA
ncbi:MAG: NRDE family protein [Myxococcota bacterium]